MGHDGERDRSRLGHALGHRRHEDGVIREQDGDPVLGDDPVQGRYVPRDVILHRAIVQIDHRHDRVVLLVPVSHEHRQNIADIRFVQDADPRVLHLPSQEPRRRQVRVVADRLRDEVEPFRVRLLAHQMDGRAEAAEGADDRLVPEVASGAVEQVAVQQSDGGPLSGAAPRGRPASPRRRTARFPLFAALRHRGERILDRMVTHANMSGDVARWSCEETGGQP
jgi:hypothetical protein